MPAWTRCVGDWLSADAKLGQGRQFWYRKMDNQAAEESFQGCDIDDLCHWMAQAQPSHSYSSGGRRESVA